ncbi:MAG TPA: hypothetical protein PK490_17930, partial [Prosthecobacter sp.]|nr:hypothetical protein [Prosthecobacter sp.]
MTALRLIILLLCLGGGGWHLERERQAGRLRQVDEWFLDFLTANARERLETPDPAAAPEVALVTLRERDRAEYAAWPPPPLDWRTILQGLAPFEPDVLVVAAPLNWGQPAPDFLPALAEALLAFPSVVLGMEAQWQDVPPPHAPFLGGLEDQLPRLSNVSGDAELAPSLKALVTAPDPALLGQSELGVLAVRAEGGGWRLPY